MDFLETYGPCIVMTFMFWQYQMITFIVTFAKNNVQFFLTCFFLQKFMLTSNFQNEDLSAVKNNYSWETEVVVLKNYL